MWLFTRFGFFSVVQKQGDHDLTIRSRTRGDLDRLRFYYLPQLSQSQVHGGSDYPWRATAAHDELAEAMKRITQEIDYPNFKDEVALSLEKKRAQHYGKVWNALYGMAEDLPEPSPCALEGLGWDITTSSKPMAYGGVVIDPAGNFLLREVKNHFDGYVWSFAKGKPSGQESPRETALREVKEETGVTARILAPIPGQFGGGTTSNSYFLMVAARDTVDLKFESRETAGLCWATPDEARRLFAHTNNTTGRKRDLAVLEAALACRPRPLPLQRPIALRENWIRRPLPAKRVTLPLERRFTQKEMAHIYRGFIPSEMEEKWFAFYEDGVLHLHRSWTGICIYQVYFKPVEGYWLAYSVNINRHFGQYQETRNQTDLENLNNIIRNLLMN